ncbi:MAG TPA: TonB-dependent receptor plug domain-containing protein [Bryobacteraceae bacterium]|nr:TonB-dependent receptor plug domain-containing protein [Bryobacteraceae bacterium]
MRALTGIILLACTVEVAVAQHLGGPTDDLDKLSVEELFTLQVTSVGRKAQQLSKAPAAVFVLTAEDIRRSGATCIPEALRWVPGLTVLRVDGRSWVVAARGSARLYANKMLVMIDGRSLYTPMFSGVIWDAINIPLQEIERIEVVRGPGAVMWGPNAVDGVINIITKSARAATGGQATVAAGNELLGGVEAGWGAAPNDRLAYRTWGRTEFRSPANSSLGSYLLTDLFPWQGPAIHNLNEAAGGMGFRVDGQPDDQNRWTVQGNIYRTGRHDPLAFAAVMPDDVVEQSTRTNYSGGSLEGQWTHTSSAGTESILQFSFARDNLDYSFLGASTDNFNADFQQRRRIGEQNELYWGMGFQQYSDSTYSNGYIAMVPPAFRYRAGDVVLRDEWQVVPARLLASAGVRVDYNSYHRVEYQPSVRLLYTPSAQQSAWLAISRAVRLPNRFDRDMLFDGGAVMADGFPIELVGYPVHKLLSEVERSLESYRIQSGQRWSVDATLFWSYYKSMVAFAGPPTPVPGGPSDPAGLELPIWANNAGAGRTYGAEVWGVWQAVPGWRLIPGYSYLNENWWLPSSNDLAYAWDRPRSGLHHQGTLRSQIDLSRHWRLDLMARARSRDATFALPGAFLMDARLAWLCGKSSELSLAVQDLTGRRVLETYSEGPFAAIPTARSFVIRWSQRF